MLKHHAMRTYGALEVKLQAFLSSALDGGESLAPHSDCVKEDSPWYSTL
jgi:hypothetical protein